MLYSCKNVRLWPLAMVMIFSSLTVHATSLTPAQIIKLESLQMKCAEPGVDCPMISEDRVLDVVFIAEDEEYFITQGSEGSIAEDDGLLVFIEGDYEQGEITETLFIPLVSVGLSPDTEFYRCAKGEEYVFNTSINFESLKMDPTDAKAYLDNFLSEPSFGCDCFWMPQRVFDALDLDKVAKQPNEQSTDEIEAVEEPAVESTQSIEVVDATTRPSVSTSYRASLRGNLRSRPFAVSPYFPVYPFNPRPTGGPRNERPPREKPRTDRPISPVPVDVPQVIPTYFGIPALWRALRH